MNRTARIETWAMVAVVCAALFHGGASAADNAPFEWKRLNIYVGTTSGGGYDAYTRLFARYVGKYLPGHPSALPINRPGAGGLALMNQIYASGMKDGTDLAVVAPGFVIDRVLYGDQSHAQFESSKFNWIGSMNEDPSVFVTWRAKGVTLQDVLAGKPITVGMPGPGGGPWFYSRVLNALFGTKLKIISGYPGVAEVLLAIESGELDGVAGTQWYGLKAVRERWLTSGSVDLLLQYGKERLKDLPDVPSVYDIAKDQKTRDILGILSRLELITRPIFAPPGVPPERVAILREAFDQTMRDPEFLDEAARQSLPIVPMLGPDVQQLVNKISTPPEDIVSQLRDIYRE